jgi:predicted nuclease with TOPRIM domain
MFTSKKKLQREIDSLNDDIHDIRVQHKIHFDILKHEYYDLCKRHNLLLEYLELKETKITANIKLEPKQ